MSAKALINAGGHTLQTPRQRKRKRKIESFGSQRTWALHVGWRLAINIVRRLMRTCFFFFLLCCCLLLDSVLLPPLCCQESYPVLLWFKGGEGQKLLASGM